MAAGPDIRVTADIMSAKNMAEDRAEKGKRETDSKAD
jgi:hypothetical protein